MKKLNKEKGFSMAVMMDTEGSEVHMGDLGGPGKAEVGSKLESALQEARQSNENENEIEIERL